MLLPCPNRSRANRDSVPGEKCKSVLKGTQGPTPEMTEAATKTRGSNAKAPANPTEQECPACNGTGYLLVVQPVRPGRKIYPPPSNKCCGRGQITEDAN